MLGVLGSSHFSSLGLYVHPRYCSPLGFNEGGDLQIRGRNAKGVRD